MSARSLAFGRAVPLSPGARVLVHCHMGISRSTAAAILILAQAHPDLPETEIVAEIARVRPRAWPNLRMIEMGDAILERNGRLVAAVRARHRAVAEAKPEMVVYMRQLGRHRELEGL